MLILSNYFFIKAKDTAISQRLAATTLPSNSFIDTNVADACSTILDQLRAADPFFDSCELIYDVSHTPDPILVTVSFPPESADKALAIAPECAPTHALLGEIASNHDNDLVAAARYTERALELEPVNPDILIDAARLFRYLGRLGQGTALLEYVVARDPVNPTGHFYLGLNYFYVGRPDEAIASFRTTLSLSPGYVNAQANLGGALLFKAKPDAFASSHVADKMV